MGRGRISLLRPDEDASPATLHRCTRPAPHGTTIQGDAPAPSRDVQRSMHSGHMALRSWPPLPEPFSTRWTRVGRRTWEMDRVPGRGVAEARPPRRPAGPDWSDCQGGQTDEGRRSGRCFPGPWCGSVAPSMRRGSRKLGKSLPVLSFGMRSPTRPARIGHRGSSGFGVGARKPDPNPSPLMATPAGEPHHSKGQGPRAFGPDRNHGRSSSGSRSRLDTHRRALASAPCLPRLGELFAVLAASRSSMILRASIRADELALQTHTARAMPSPTLR